MDFLQDIVSMAKELGQTQHKLEEAENKITELEKELSTRATKTQVQSWITITDDYMHINNKKDSEIREFVNHKKKNNNG